MAIVRAVGVAVGTSGDPVDIPRQQRIERAMLAAVRKAQKQGVNDPDVIRERILKARGKAERNWPSPAEIAVRLYKEALAALKGI